MTEIATLVVTEAGYDLEDLAVQRVGRRLVVRVTVDGDGGVSLDKVAELSRAISDGLDAVDAELGSEPYTLEVSSPGVDRSLTQPRHWRRAVGRLVKTNAGTGRVVSVVGETVTVDIGGVERALPLADLGPGKVQVEFNRVDEAFGDVDEDDLNEDVDDLDEGVEVDDEVDDVREVDDDTESTIEAKDQK